MKKLVAIALATTFAAGFCQAQSGSTTPYYCWTKWEANGNDYNVEFVFYKLPQNGRISFSLVGLTDRARRTLNVSKDTGGIKWTATDTMIRVTLTAGWRARSAGPYGGFWASDPWSLGNEVRLYYNSTR